MKYASRNCRWSTLKRCDLIEVTLEQKKMHIHDFLSTYLCCVKIIAEGYHDHKHIPCVSLKEAHE